MKHYGCGVTFSIKTKLVLWALTPVPLSLAKVALDYRWLHQLALLR